MNQHVVTIPLAGDGYFRVICACGWLGPKRPVKSDCYADATAHRKSVK